PHQSRRKLRCSSAGNTERLYYRLLCRAGGACFPPATDIVSVSDPSGGRMRELKPLSLDAVDAALAKAERYRFLNEPGEAESTCRDILAIEPSNQPANVLPLLSLPDQFAEMPSAHHRARHVLAALTNDYEKEYYAGIIAERRAKAQLSRGGAGSSVGAYDFLA